MSTTAARQDIHEFIRHLLSAVTGAALYTLKHPQVEHLAEAAHTSLTHALSGRSDIALLEVDGELVVDGEPQAFSLVLERFVRILREHGIGHLRLLSGTPRHEVDQLISLLVRQTTSNEIISTDYIRFGRVAIPEQGSEVGSIGASGHTAGGSGIESDSGSPLYSPTHKVSLKDIPALELARLGEVYEAVKRQERLKPSGIADTVAELVGAFQREGESLLLLAALREKDEYTFTHAANVCILTLAQARALGITGQLLNDIGIAAMLHDIGKMFVPDEILTKPDRLTNDEFEQMKRHPVLGARYLTETPGVPRLAALVAFEHHMRFDQSGYPYVPTGWQQTIASQMTAISDCFDAMRTRRIYQEPREIEIIASALIQGSVTEFNPLLVKNMLQLLSRLDRI